MAHVIKAATAAPATSTPMPTGDRSFTFQGVVTGTGAVSATFVLETSDVGPSGPWLTQDTITASGTTQATAGRAVDAPWGWVQVRLTAISGTAASTDAYANAG